MNDLKLDITKLKTFTNYAKIRGVERQTVYNWEKTGEIKTVNVDGVRFVHM